MAVIVSADDDPDIRLIMVRALERDGHRVVAAHDAPSALAAIHAEGPDLVLLDVEMPGMTGLQLCRLLKADPATAAVPVVIVSGAISPPYDDVLAAGAAAGLSKPFTPRQLRECVAAHLAAQLARRPSAVPA